MPSKHHIRADALIVEQNLATSRAQASALIIAGKCFIETERITKPGQFVHRNTIITVRKPLHPWVGRGGIKLQEAFNIWKLNVCDNVVADIGSSTGGFTDVLLHHGALRVHAVDVGRGQLHEKLRQDPRVINHENLNARYLTHEHIQEPLDALVCDVSFIGLEKLLPAPMALIKNNGWLVALVKPQFQLSRNLIGKGGVVRDPELHQQACQIVTSAINQQHHWQVVSVLPSPVTGSAGNVEFLLYAIKTG